MLNINRHRWFSVPTTKDLCVTITIPTASHMSSFNNRYPAKINSSAMFSIKTLILDETERHDVNSCYDLAIREVTSHEFNG